MCTTPRVLVATPLHAHHEEEHAGDGKEAAEVVNLSENLLAAQALAVGSRGRVVEHGRHDKTDESPEAAPEADVAPCGVRGDELRPEHRWAERDDGEHQDGNVLAALGSRCKLRCHSQCGKLVDSSANPREDHAADEDVHRVCR